MSAPAGPQPATNKVLIGAVTGGCAALLLAAAMLLCLWRRRALRARGPATIDSKDGTGSETRLTVRGAAVQLASPKAPSGSIMLQVRSCALHVSRSAPGYYKMLRRAVCRQEVDQGKHRTITCTLISKASHSGTTALHCCVSSLLPAQV